MPASAMIPTATPTPMPALAPGARALEVVVEGAGVAELVMAPLLFELGVVADAAVADGILVVFETVAGFEAADALMRLITSVSLD